MNVKHDSKEADELWAKADGLWNEGRNEEAFRILLALAKEGHGDSQVSAGYYLDHGIGVEKNPEEAMKWYRRAVRNGGYLGAYNLGMCYLSSNKFSRAKFWFIRSMNMGMDRDGAFCLGKMYAALPSKASQKRALEWLNFYLGAKSKFEDDEKEARKLSGC